jgi:hypothetical protein
MRASAPPGSIGSAGQAEHDGLGKGGLTAVITIIVFTTLACTCFVFALCGARRRRQRERDAAGGAPSAAAAPGDVAAATMLEVLACRDARPATAAAATTTV